jgi:hypothetical protein
MKQSRVEEPLLPPWVAKAAARLAPLAVLVLLWWLLSSVFNLPGTTLTLVLIVPGFAALVYFGGRFYKPFYVNKEGRCVAGGAKERAGCRHYVPGARLGGGCGRLRENGRCRYVTG